MRCSGDFKTGASTIPYRILEMFWWSHLKITVTGMVSIAVSTIDLKITYILYEVNEVD